MVFIEITIEVSSARVLLLCVQIALHNYIIMQTHVDVSKYTESQCTHTHAYTYTPAAQALIVAEADQTDLGKPDELLCMCCCAGLGGLKMPQMVIRAWKLGLRQIFLTGAISNWARYIFVILQSLLLAGAMLYSYFFEDGIFFKYPRMVVLGIALLINILERFFHCCNKKNAYWNFCTDFIRLFVTEFLIYIALISSIHDTSLAESYRDNDSNLNDTELEGNQLYYGYGMLGATALLFFLTVVVMKNFTVISVTRSLLKARVGNYSNASRSQKLFLYGLCIHTAVLTLVQAGLLVTIGLLHNSNEPIPSYENDFFVIPFAFLFVAEVVATLLFFLYFSWTMPWARYFPISMLLDLPRDHSWEMQTNRQTRRVQVNMEEPLNLDAISSWFQDAHHSAMTCGGITKNFLRLLTSPLQCVGHIAFIAAGAYTVIFLLYIAYAGWDLSNTRLLIPPLVTLLLLITVSLPSLLLGLLMSALLPLAFIFMISYWLYQGLAEDGSKCTVKDTLRCLFCVFMWVIRKIFKSGILSDD